MSIQLHVIDPNKVFGKIPALKSNVMGLKSTAEGIVRTATTFGAPLPIGDINVLVKQLLEAEAKKYINEGKEEAIVLVLVALAEFLAENPPPVEEIARKLNPVIDKLNTIINAIDGALTFLENQINTITVAMNILMVVYIATKILSLIPAITIGIGGGIAFTQHISICSEINMGVGKVLKEISTIAISILSVMLMLLNFFAFLAMIVGMISNFLSTLMGLLNSLISDSLKTADDWANTSTFESDMEDANNNMNKTGDDNVGERLDLMNKINELQFLMGQNLINCELPDGSVEQLSPEECLARGGTILDGSGILLDLQNLLNNLGGPLSDDDLLNLGNCTLPDGSVKQMTLEDCLAAGGVFGGTGDLIITSLLNLNNDITLKKATKNKGKRYGFYQSDIKNNRRN